MTDILHILGLWRGRALWLVAGIVVSLAALAAGVAMMALGGVVLGAAVAVGTLAAPVALRGLGTARVVLRYTERLLTHAATFRALADLRVWFFRNLAHGSAGGLGFRQAGDVLARLVGDIEALDGLYLRILVPLAGAVLLFPLLVVLVGIHSVWLALAVGVLFAVAAFALPWLSARAAARAGAALA
ncbi:MAG: thiol reductant ABC exporter subunit CydC, partial [Acetobacteraceae bacterium]